jgi:hypothetical protein
VSWLLPIANAFGICNERIVIEKALRFLTDTAGFAAKSSDIEEDVRGLAAQGELVRSVRYLQILLEGRSWKWN